MPNIHNSNQYPEELSETIHERGSTSTDSAGSLEETIDDTAAPADQENAPKLSEAYILRQFELSTEHQHRYHIGPVLGSGSGGIVYEISDFNLDRSAAIKFLPAHCKDNPRKIEKFIHEALITAQLDHPNILPIYTLQTTDQNEIFYIMKKVEGIPLKELTCNEISTSKPEDHELVKAHEELNEIINIIIKVSETIAYAHSKGIIHRDIKPSNIMLDKYGEVRVVDWGTAIGKDQYDKQEGKMAGTPLYMGPEQAQRHGADKRSDIYAIGATLFHVLFKRPPLLAVNQDAFWVQKRIGHINQPTPQERKQIPKPLLAICMKCLEPKPENRYQDADQLINELKAFLTGGTIHAYNYSFIELIKTWYKHNKNNAKWAMLIFIFFLISGLFWYDQYQRQFAGWGVPVHTETFNDSKSWDAQWKIIKGSADIENNTLVTKDGPAFLAFYDKPIQGSIRIEFDGTILPNSSPGDLSIVYTPDLLDTDNQKTPRNIYYLQHGSQGNQSSTILGPSGRLDYSINSLAIGTTHKIRADVDGKEMRLYLNDTLICSHEFLFPLTSGYIGIYGFYSHKQFDNIRIYSKELPEITNIIKTGDLLYENGLYDLAAKRYHKIIKAHQGTALGEEAQYKYALCHYQQGLINEAFQIWDQLKKDTYQQHITFYRWDEYFKSGAYEKLFSEMGDLYSNSDRDIQKKIEVKWSSLITKARTSINVDLVRLLFDFRSKHFPNDQRSSISVYYALRLLGESKKALELFPKQTAIKGRALLDMGRYDQLLNDPEYAEQRHLAAEALEYTGDYNTAINSFSDIRENLLDALIAAGYHEKAKQEFANDPISIGRILLAEGAYDQVIESYPENTPLVLNAYTGAGKIEQYFEKLSTLETLNKTQSSAIELRNYLLGQTQSLQRLKDIVATYDIQEQKNILRIFERLFIADVLEAINGQPHALEQRAKNIYNEKKEMMGMRLWHCCALLLGEIDDKTFLEQPHQHMLQHEYHLFKGIHEDIWGDKQNALKHYLALRQLKPHQKVITMINTLFIEYRLQALQSQN